MRKRYLVAVGAVALLATGTAVAVAEGGDTAAASSTTPSRSVTLPTGDVVEVPPRGGFGWLPATGREDVGYLTPPAADGSGDLIAIPLDRLAAVAAGEEDPRRYNVSELLRSGETDAAKAKALSDKAYGRFSPEPAKRPRSSAADQKVELDLTARDGEAPEAGVIAYLNLDTEAMDVVGTDADGHASVALPPGRYDFQTLAADGTQHVLGLKSVTLDDAPVSITMDGTASREVEYRVDRPVELSEQILHAYTVMKDGVAFGNSISMPPQDTGYLIPTEIDDHRAGIEAMPHLVGTDPDDPYVYDLNFFHTDGIPDDAVFTARDAELAQVRVDYDGFATKEPVSACNNSFRDGGLKMIGCRMQPVAWQGGRTEYLTPGEDLDWFSTTVVGAEGSEAASITSVDSYRAGPSRRTVGAAPLSFNVAGSRLSPVLVRQGDVIYGSFPFLDNADAAEVITGYRPLTGTAVLSRDGEELARTRLSGENVEFTLPDGDSGRYTLAVTASRSDDFTPLALETAVTWEFDSAPAKTDTMPDISAVGFDAEGITDGFAAADTPQKFTLDYRAQEGATDTRLHKLTFEVSYDDGKTWHKVKVKVKGDKATGTLHHPEGAEFVSVRATATDDAGNKVTHSTIHTHGLR